MIVAVESTFLKVSLIFILVVVDSVYPSLPPLSSSSQDSDGLHQPLRQGDNDSASPRIWYGSKVDDRKDVPWLGWISCKGVPSSCGATFISKEFLLTAASCVVVPSTLLKAASCNYVVGGLNLAQTRDEQFEYSETATSSDIYQHENYVPGPTPINDIALVKVAPRISPAVRNEMLKPITLADPAVDYSNSAATIFGWGSTESVSAESNEDVFYSETAIRDTSTCKSAWNCIQDAFASENHICFGGPPAKNYVCDGDMGGPLVVQSSSGDSIQVGIISFTDLTDSPTCDACVALPTSSTATSASQTPRLQTTSKTDQQVPVTLPGNQPGKLGAMASFLHWVQKQLAQTSLMVTPTPVQVRNVPQLATSGPTCCTKKPAIATKVTAYLQWIEKAKAAIQQQG